MSRFKNVRPTMHMHLTKSERDRQEDQVVDIIPAAEVPEEEQAVPQV